MDNQSWPEESPFAPIILTVASEHIPSTLLKQLASGGCLIASVGGQSQNLVLIRRSQEGYEQTNLLPVRFVPMTGRAQQE